MNDTVKKIFGALSYALCALLGFLHFIFMFIPYTSVYLSWGSLKESQGVSGYKILSQYWDLGFTGVLCALLQLVILLFAVAMLAYGVLGLLKEFGIVSVLPDEFMDFSTKTISEYVLYAWAGLNALLFVLLIVCNLAHNESQYGASAGISLHVGIFITLIFAAAGALAPKLLPKYLPDLFDGAEAGPKVSYVCSTCGTRAKKGAAFCSACGGLIEEKVTMPEPKKVYSCVSCGATAKKGQGFCTICGGKVEEREINTQPKTAYVCANCGASAEKGQKFCVSCGGNVEEKVVE